MIIGVDIDLTVVDSLTPWLEWYFEKTGHDIKEEMQNKNFNIEKLMHNHNDPMEYWKMVDLYDRFKPIENSVEVLSELNESNDIIFVSDCFPEHLNSKVNFIKKHFPFYLGFINTKQKQYVNCDVLIDDYDENLYNIQKFNPECECFHYETELNFKQPKLKYGNWKYIEENLCNI